MFSIRKAEPQTHPLDETIDNAISELAGLDAGSEESARATEALRVLMELRVADKASAKRPPISADTLAVVAANLLGIGMILGFEKANVITSKSLSFVMKPKI